MDTVVDCVWNVMAYAQKPYFVFRRKGRVHLKRRGLQFSRLLAAEVCASAVVMLDTPCCEVVWRVLAIHSIRRFPLHFPSRASPCAITFQLDSTTWFPLIAPSACVKFHNAWYCFKTANHYWCVFGLWKDMHSAKWNETLTPLTYYSKILIFLLLILYFSRYRTKVRRRKVKIWTSQNPKKAARQKIRVNSCRRSLPK